MQNHTASGGSSWDFNLSHLILACSDTHSVFWRTCLGDKQLGACYQRGELCPNPAFQLALIYGI